MTAHNITSKSKIIAAAVALAAVPGLALAGMSVGDSVGTSDEEIRAALTAQGYSIEEIENEDGKFEAEVVLNGQTFEIEIDPHSGNVLEIEEDD